MRNVSGRGAPPDARMNAPHWVSLAQPMLRLYALTPLARGDTGRAGGRDDERQGTRGARLDRGVRGAHRGLPGPICLTGSAQNSRGRKSWIADRGSRLRNAVVIHRRMVKSLEQAIAEVANLPEADQEQIGRRLLVHVEKLRQLRAEIDKGIRSLDAGE